MEAGFYKASVAWSAFWLAVWNGRDNPWEHNRAGWGRKDR